MEKLTPFLVMLTLLIGLLITVASTRSVSVNIQGSACGQSIYALIPNRKIKPLNACNNSEYGWPARYVKSSSMVYVLNHSSGAAGATVYSYSSFSRLKIGADWALWSVLSGIVVFGGAYLMMTNNQSNKKKTKK